LHTNLGIVVLNQPAEMQSDTTDFILSTE